jgi:hypothetical protein
VALGGREHPAPIIEVLVYRLIAQIAQHKGLAEGLRDPLCQHQRFLSQEVELVAFYPSYELVSKDVLIEDARANPAIPTTAYSYDCFKADYADDTKNTNNCGGANMPSPGTLAKMQGVGDELCDWDSAPPDFASGACFKVQGQPAGQGNYNTNGRTAPKGNGFVKVQDVGFGAEGTICSVPPISVPTTGTCEGRPSIASAVDGYVYDSTTTPQFIAKELWDPPLDPGANGDVNPPNTITYPFPRLEPKGEYFRELVEDPTKGTYWEGQPADPTWGLSTSSADKVAFVDAGGGTVQFNPSCPSIDGLCDSGNKNNSGSSYKGIIVVWCGNLQQDANFRGIIFNLYGEGLSSSDGDPNTDCQNDDGSPQQVQTGVDVGVYTNNGRSCTCWVFAEGGTSTRAGIILRPNSSADFLPGGVWDSSLPSEAFVGPPNGVRYQELAGTLRVEWRDDAHSGSRVLTDA